MVDKTPGEVSQATHHSNRATHHSKTHANQPSRSNTRLHHTTKCPQRGVGRKRHSSLDATTLAPNHNCVGASTTRSAWITCSKPNLDFRCGCFSVGLTDVGAVDIHRSLCWGICIVLGSLGSELCQADIWCVLCVPGQCVVPSITT